MTKSLSSHDVIRMLQADGWEWVDDRGDHRQFTHPQRNGRVTVPHPTKDIPIGTLRSIYRQAGWDWNNRR